jgi:hypothetical protein
MIGSHMTHKRVNETFVLRAIRVVHFRATTVTSLRGIFASPACPVRVAQGSYEVIVLVWHHSPSYTMHHKSVRIRSTQHALAFMSPLLSEETTELLQPFACD